MTIQVQARIRIKLKKGQCAACYQQFPCLCINAFFAEPDMEQAPDESDPIREREPKDTAERILVAFLLLTLVVGASVVMYEAGKVVWAFLVVRGWLN